MNPFNSSLRPESIKLSLESARERIFRVNRGSSMLRSVMDTRVTAKVDANRAQRQAMKLKMAANAAQYLPTAVTPEVLRPAASNFALKEVIAQPVINSEPSTVPPASIDLAENTSSYQPIPNMLNNNNEVTPGITAKVIPEMTPQRREAEVIQLEQQSQLAAAYEQLATIHAGQDVRR